MKIEATQRRQRQPPLLLLLRPPPPTPLAVPLPLYPLYVTATSATPQHPAALFPPPPHYQSTRYQLLPQQGRRLPVCTVVGAVMTVHTTGITTLAVGRYYMYVAIAPAIRG